MFNLCCTLNRGLLCNQKNILEKREHVHFFGLAFFGVLSKVAVVVSSQWLIDLMKHPFLTKVYNITLGLLQPHF